MFMAVIGRMFSCPCESFIMCHVKIFRPTKVLSSVEVEGEIAACQQGFYAVICAFAGCDACGWKSCCLRS
jgi:hypothetical protein